MARWKKIVLAVPLLLALGAGLASAPWCRAVEAKPPELLMVGASQMPLRAGAASVALTPPLPITRAGYGPGRPVATSAATPLNARALVIDSGGTTWGVVVLDALLIPTDLADEVRAKAELGEVWVVATHSHSAFGGYDTRWAAQLAATGRYDARARQALVSGALEAIKRARATLRPCAVSAASTAPADLSWARSGPAADGRLTRVAFTAPDGPIAELLIASAHPTTAGREATVLDADWPGALAAAREAGGSGVSLVVQGSAGNASVALREGEAVPAWVQRVAGEANAVPVREAGDKGLVLVRVGVTLPDVDSTRLVSGLLQPATKNVLCTQSDGYVTLSLVRVGRLTLLAVPGEATLAVGRALEEKASADRLVSLAGGYIGYVEAAEMVDKNEGEARRQYYGAGLATVLEAGARTAFEAMSLVVSAGAQPPPPPPQ